MCGINLVVTPQKSDRFGINSDYVRIDVIFKV